MLNNLSEQIRKCLMHAEDCARKAAAESNPQLKRDFQEVERRWLLLARSYELSGRLTDFSAQAKRRVFYALHIRRKDGHGQIEHYQHGRLPTSGELMPVSVRGEQINVRVLNVITSPAAKERGELVHNVYAVEVYQRSWFA